MLQAQRNKYMQTSIHTATPEQLLIMLYDGAIRFCRQAIDAFHRNNHQEMHNNLIKVQDIISEFEITLNRTTDISRNLSRLYEYFKFRLTEANIHKQVQPVEEVLGYLVELKETWVQAAIAAKQTEQRQPAISGGQV